MELVLPIPISVSYLIAFISPACALKTKHVFKLYSLLQLVYFWCTYHPELLLALTTELALSLSLSPSGTVCPTCGKAEGERAGAVCFIQPAMRNGRWWIPPLRTLQNTNLQLRVSAVRTLHSSTDVRGFSAYCCCWQTRAVFIKSVSSFLFSSPLAMQS